jgi:hypothetical protein
MDPHKVNIKCGTNKLHNFFHEHNSIDKDIQYNI